MEYKNTQTKKQNIERNKNFVQSGVVGFEFTSTMI